MRPDDESERIEVTAIGGCLAITAAMFFALMMIAIIGVFIWRRSI